MEQYTGGLVSIDRHPARATLRSFGLALALVSGAWSWSSTTAAVSVSLVVLLASVAVLRPSALRGPYVLLGVLTFPVRWLLSFAVLAAVYFLIITPVALGVRLARRIQHTPSSQSNWRVSPPRADKPSYFRQF